MNDEKPSEISEKTKMPISLTITFCTLFVLGALRVQAVSFKADSNEKEIIKLQIINESLADELKSINSNLTLIKYKLKIGE